MMSAFEFLTTADEFGLRLFVDVTAKASALLVVAAMVARFLPNSSAAVRHRVWVLGLSGALVLPVFSWLLPPLSIPVAQEGKTSHSQVAPRATNVGRQHSHDVGQRGHERRLKSASLAIERMSHAHRPDRLSNAGAALRITLRNYLLLIWVTGSVGVFVPVLIGVTANRRQLQFSERITDGPSIELVANLSHLIGLTRRVTVFESSRPVIPMTWGVVHPVVLLPRTWRDWSQHQCRCVLLHELAHVHRRDVVFQLVARLAVAFHWFNPLVWYGLRQLRVEKRISLRRLRHPGW